MNVRRTIAVVLLSLMCGWGTSRLMSEELPEKANSDRDALAKLNQDVATLSVKLAENELQVLVEANRRLPNTFPRSTIARAEQVVAAAKQRAARASSESAKDLRSSYLAQTESEMKAADIEYRSALAANQRAKNAVPPLELERLKLVAQLAKLRHDRVLSTSDIPDSLLLSWQLEDVREQLRRLAQQVELYRGNE